LTEWSLEPIYNSSLAVLLIAIGLAVLLAIGPRFGKLSPRRRWTITGLRAVVILLVLLAMLRPTHIYTQTKPRSSVLLVLFDVSRSMLLPDSTAGQTRWAAQKAALAKISEVLPQLTRHAEVRVYGYDSQLHAIDASSGEITAPKEPSGNQTDTGSTADEAFRRETGKRISAALVIGDGRDTAFNPQTESAAAARRLRDEFAAPWYSIALGPAGDTAQAKDVAIERLDEQYTVFVKNEVVIRGRMKIAGYANQAVPVEAVVTDLAGKETLIGKLAKTARQEGEGQEFEFAYLPETPGHFKVTVRAAAQPGELVTKNNELSAYLTVLEGGLRVLLIDGGKRAEFKFLRRSLNDSPDIEVDDLIIDSLNRKSWPVNLGTTLKDGKYDVYILGNVPAEALGDTNMQDLAAEVERGKGLLATGGLRTLNAGNYFDTPLAAVLPIVLTKYLKQDFAEPDRPDLFTPGPLAMTPTTPHAVTRLAEGPENVAAWQKLPPLDFANTFTAIKPSPGVRLLLTGPKEEPLLVSGEYGSGRVLAFAGESTYRWPLKGMQSQHKRFWRQSILWLARRDESQQSDVWVKLAQRRFQPGANVHFTLGARSPEGDVLADAQFSVTLLGPDGKPQTLRFSPSGDHQAGVTTVNDPGDYAIEIVATRNGQTLGKARAEFLVFDQDVELSNAAADHEHLARLAAITKEFGGRSVPPEELGSLLSEIANRPPEMEVRQQKWRLGDTALTAWTWLIAFASVLGIEWWLRKKWGLV
jgi:hypothetical protein